MVRFISKLTIVIVLVGAGCSTPSLKQVSNFGTATSALADHSKKAYEVVDSSTVARKMYDVASDTKLFPKDDTFKGIFSGTEAEALKVRLSLLSSLGAYAEALHKLATADFRKDIDDASGELNSALVGLNKRYTEVSGKGSPLKDSDLQIVATAVDGIGAAIAEGKRRKAIKTIILKADDVVQESIRLLTKDLGPDSSLAKYVTQNLISADGSLRTAYNTEKKNMSFNARYEMLQNIRKLNDAANASPEFFKNVSKGATKVGQAHAALKKGVKAKKFSSAEVSEAVGELADYAKSVKSFYETLNLKQN